MTTLEEFSNLDTLDLIDHDLAANLSLLTLQTPVTLIKPILTSIQQYAGRPIDDGSCEDE